MTIQTQVLELQLGALQSKAQQLLSDRAVVDAIKLAEFWQALAGVSAELRRALWQFADLARKRAQMLGENAAVPQDPSGSVQFENELTRVQRRAGLLAGLIAKLRRRTGDASTVDLTHAICLLGTQLGKPLDQFMVRYTVQLISASPMFGAAHSVASAARAHTGGVIDTLFVSIGMLVGFAPAQSPSRSR